MPSARLPLFLCSAIAVVEGFDLQAGGLTAPAIRHQFSLTLSQMTAFLTASTVGLFFGAILGGRLSDFMTRRAVLAAAVATLGIFSIVTALCEGIPALTIARLLTGFGIGGALPNIIALGAESAAMKQRKAIVAWIFAGIPLGGGLASGISSAVGVAHWRTLYYVGGALPLLLTPLLLRKPANWGAAVTGAQRSTPLSINVALFGGGRTLATIIVWAAFCLMQLSSHLLLNWLPTLMIIRGFDSTHAALIQISYGILGALGCVLVGVLLRRFEAHFVALGVAVWLIGMLIVLGGVAKGFFTVALITGLASAGMMGCLVMNYASAPLIYPNSVRGTGVGAAVSIGRLGSIAGPVLGGILIGDHGSFRAVLAGITPIILVGALCSASVYYLIRQSQPQQTDPA